MDLHIKPISYYQYIKQTKNRKYITPKGKEYKELIETEMKKYMEKNKIEKIEYGDVFTSIELYFDNKRKNDLDNFFFYYRNIIQ